MYNYLNNKKILIGITGGIAAYKVLELIRRLTEQGATVKTILTKNAKDFVTELSVAALSGAPVTESSMAHIELARWADVLLVAPATANFIAKLAHGLADDLLSTTCLAATGPILIAPAMNQQMWQHHGTQENLAILSNRELSILGPASGKQACGEVGPGRMLEPNDLLQMINAHFAPQILTGKRIVITAGPTQEHIDPIRFLSNHSSGKMGYALARAAVKLGGDVTLISGPTNLDIPSHTNFISVVTAAEMYISVMNSVADKKADILISCAAVADYTPKIIEKNKLKKSTDNLVIELEPTKDILLAVGNLPEDLRPFTMGFAAETENLLENAQKKLHNKNLDLIVANAVDNGKVFGQDYNEVVLVRKNSAPELLPKQHKASLAYELLAACCE